MKRGVQEKGGSGPIELLNKREKTSRSLPPPPDFFKVFGTQEGVFPGVPAFLFQFSIILYHIQLYARFRKLSSGFITFCYICAIHLSEKPLPITPTPPSYQWWIQQLLDTLCNLLHTFKIFIDNDCLRLHHFGHKNSKNLLHLTNSGLSLDTQWIQPSNFDAFFLEDFLT